MSARDLLHDLLAGGFDIRADGGALLVTPASRLAPERRASIRAHKTELLALLAEPQGVMWVSGVSSGRPQESVSRRFVAKLPAQADSRPYRLSQADAAAARAQPWGDAACARFQARVTLLQRLGFNELDAEDLAEGLRLRDAHADHRASCLECRHLSGRVGAWRCGNHAVAGVAPDLPLQLVVLHQVCPGQSNLNESAT